MDRLISFLFSLFDSASVLAITFSTFGISLKQNVSKIIILAFFLNVVSCSLVYLGVHILSIPILITLLILSFFYLFKENIWFSIWISVVGTVAFMTVQGLIASTALVSGLMTQDDMQPFTTKGYVAQAITFFVVVVVAIYQKRFGESFYFDFDNVFKKKKNLNSTKPYVLAATALGITFAFVYPNLYKSDANAIFYVTLTLTIILFSVLMFLSSKRNKDERISAFS